MSSSFPDYYEILHIQPRATEKEIRDAYKKQSLLTHPDRLKNPTDAERQRATERFQTVADAYYVLSDPSRRRAYDSQRQARQSSYASSDMPGGFGADNSGTSSANFFNAFFGKGGPGYAHADEDATSSTGSESARPDADHIFTDVFEDLLTPEVERIVPFWKWAGAGAGAVIGFIVGNLPGAAVGAYGGGKLGQIRDAKGRAVASVFKDLSSTQRYQILTSLLSKVMSQVTA